MAAQFRPARWKFRRVQRQNRREYTMQRFNGRCAIVTGGASGIGAGVAARLAQEGAQVCLIDRDIDQLRVQAERMAGSVERVSFLQADVGDELESRAAFHTA